MVEEIDKIVKNVKKRAVNENIEKIDSKEKLQYAIISEIIRGFTISWIVFNLPNILFGVNTFIEFLINLFL